MPEIVPTRRAVVRTAAWTVPAVTVAAAAPAFAASRENFIDLSTSVITTAPTRVPERPSNVSVPATTFTNTGDLPAQGFTVAITSTVAISNIYLPGGTTPISMLGVTVAGLGTTNVGMVVPASLGTIPANGSFTSPVAQEFAFATPETVTMTTTVTGTNGAATESIPFVSPSSTIPAL